MGKSLWDHLTVSLDDDQRLVFPEMYEEHKHMYSELCEVVHLMMGPKYGEFDIVRDNEVGRVQRRFDGQLVDILTLYVVRIRLPWNGPYEIVLSEEEYMENPDRYHILDVYISVSPKDGSGEIRTAINKREFETNRDNYDLLEVRYSVGIRGWQEKNIEQIVPRDRIHAFVSE